MKIAIAGAGIAGLASATFLARAGHHVQIFDQFQQPRPVGSGLMIQPVGLAVLEMLGLDTALIENASPVTRIYGETPVQTQGSPFRTLPVLHVSYADLRPGLCGYGVQRHALFQLLFDAALDVGVELTTDAQITGTQTGSLRTAKGDIGPFDLIVDALGAYSPLCPKPSAPLKFGALWALLDWPEDGPFHDDRLEQRYEYASKMVGVLPVGRSDPHASRKMTFFWSLRATGHEGWRTQPLSVWKDQVQSLWPETESILDQITKHDDLTFAQYTHRTLGKPY